MGSVVFSGLGILGALLLVALNGVFVAAESATRLSATATPCASTRSTAPGWLESS